VRSLVQPAEHFTRRVRLGRTCS